MGSECPHCGGLLNIVKVNVTKSKAVSGKGDLLSGIMKSTVSAVEEKLDSNASNLLSAFNRCAAQTFTDGDESLSGSWLNNLNKQMQIREEVIKHGGILPGQAHSEEEAQGANIAAKIQGFLTGR